MNEKYGQTEQTCYAHANARALHRTLRILGLAPNPREMYEKIYETAISIGAITRGGDGLLTAHTKQVATMLLEPEWSVNYCPDVLDLRPFIKLKVVDCSDDGYDDILKQSLKAHREPITRIIMYKSQFDDLFMAMHFPPVFEAITERHIAQGQHDLREEIIRHAVSLEKFDETMGTWHFKNSWGSDWGNNGKFVMKPLNLTSTVIGEPTEFIDFSYDMSALPAAYRVAAENFDPTKQAFEAPPPVKKLETQDDYVVDLNEAGTEIVLGRGMKGTVYKGKYKGMPCAVKKLNPVDNDTLPRELRYAFEHPNLVKNLAYFVSKKNPLAALSDYEIIVEFQEHGTLAMLQREIASLPVEIKQWIILSILLDISSALVYLHRLGFTHGDIHSSNILIGGDFHAKLCDFGSMNASMVSMSVEFAGHLFWFDPDEVERLQSIVSPDLVMWDIYSFGTLIMYLLFNGDVRTTERDRPPEGTPTMESLFRLMQLCRGKEESRLNAEVLEAELLAIATSMLEIEGAQALASIPSFAGSLNQSLISGLFVRLISIVSATGNTAKQYALINAGAVNGLRSMSMNKELSTEEETQDVKGIWCAWKKSGANANYELLGGEGDNRRKGGYGFVLECRQRARNRPSSSRLLHFHHDLELEQSTHRPHLLLPSSQQ